MVVRLPAPAFEGVADSGQRAPDGRAHVLHAAQAREQKVCRTVRGRVRVPAGLALGAQICRGQCR